MKLWIGLTGLLAISAANAATISCTPVNNNVVINGALAALPLAFNCPTTSAAGSSMIAAVAIEVFVSFQDSVSGGAHQLMATATESSAEIAGSVVSTVITPISDYVGFDATTGLGGSVAASSGSAGLNTIASFIVNVNAASLGGAIPNSASVTVGYTTVEAPGAVSDVPESSGLALSSAGLLVVGLVFRRRMLIR